MRALVASASTDSRAGFRRMLRDLGADVTTAVGRDSLLRALTGHEFDLVVVQRDLLGDPPAAALAELNTQLGHHGILVIGDSITAEDHARLLSAGPLAILDAGLPPELLAETLTHLVDRRRKELARRLRVRGADQVARLSDFASDSPAMRRLLETARRIAGTDSTFLVLGETGVGKEWISRAIHAAGPRADGPFVAVNCGALPDALLESELFGHEKGAFTGAVRSHRGFFELAHRGTLFLDEIGEMPVHLQVRLLRVLEERAVWPVGAERGIPVDIRIIAATNRSPEEEIAAGRLRKDLFYRLGVLSLTVPPLRERREDIPVLACAYVERFAAKFGRPIQPISAAVMEALCAYSWPGNVRELINVLERAVLLSDSGILRASDLPHPIAGAEAEFVQASSASEPSWMSVLSAGELPILSEARAAMVEAFERAYVAEVLRRSGGRVGEAALRAGLDPRSLFAKMRRLGLRKEDFKYVARAGK